MNTSSPFLPAAKRRRGAPENFAGRSELYAKQKPPTTKIANSRVRITGIRQERLGDITPRDAKREGYSTIAEYVEAFRRIYGFWDDDMTVWVVDFEKIEGEVKEREGAET